VETTRRRTISDEKRERKKGRPFPPLGQGAGHVPKGNRKSARPRGEKGKSAEKGLLSRKYNEKSAEGNAGGGDGGGDLERFTMGP